MYVCVLHFAFMVCLKYLNRNEPGSLFTVHVHVLQFYASIVHILVHSYVNVVEAGWLEFGKA